MDYNREFNRDLNEVRGGIKWPIAAAAGALVGAGIALLYAPRTGRETREALRTGAARVKEGADRVSGVVREGAEKIGHTASRLAGREQEMTPGGFTGTTGTTSGIGSSGIGTPGTTGTTGTRTRGENLGRTT